MIKRDELEQPTSCINKSKPDEPVFVLCGRDPIAPDIVLMWAKSAEFLGAHSPEKIAEARSLAQAMRDWKLENPKLPGKIAQSRPPYLGADDATMQEIFRREQVKGYMQTAAITAGSALLVSVARDKDGEPLTDGDLKKAASDASRFARFLAAEMFPEETGAV